MDNHQEIMDSSHEFVMTLLTKLIVKSGVRQLATAHTIAYSACISPISPNPMVMDWLLHLLFLPLPISSFMLVTSLPTQPHT